MDQLKVFLRGLRKYHFWVLCGLVLLLGMIGWFLATGSLQEQFTKRKSTLDGDIRNLETIRREENYPNQKVIDEIKKSHGKLRGEVFKAWQVLYEAQNKKNPWPEVLGREFLDFVGNPNLATSADIPPDLREMYQNFIGKHFPKLFGLVNIRVPGAAKDTFTGVVDWREGNRKAIQAPYTSWTSTPSSLVVRMAQEDLWVYETLLRIIQDTNAGATDHYNANVKRIESIEIGAAAAASWLNSEAFTIRFGGKEEDGSGQTNVPSPTGETPPGGEAGGPPGVDATAKKVLDKRYVDDKGKPLPVGAPHPFPEFKMMPVRMKLLMQQKYIPRLIVNGANSNMPVEFRVFRLNPEKGVVSSAPAQSTDPGMGGIGGPGVGGLGGGLAGAGGHAPGGSSDSDDKRDEKDDADPTNATVELFGIIYIFNPPAKEQLRTEAEAAAGTGGGAPAPATPVAPPATPTAPPATPPAPPATPAAPPATPAASPAGATTPPAPGATAPAAPGPAPAAAPPK